MEQLPVQLKYDWKTVNCRAGKDEFFTELLFNVLPRRVIMGHHEEDLKETDFLFNLIRFNGKDYAPNNEFDDRLPSFTKSKVWFFKDPDDQSKTWSNGNIAFNAIFRNPLPRETYFYFIIEHEIPIIVDNGCDVQQPLDA